MAKSPLIQKMLDTLQEIFFVFTIEGKILDWNKRAEEVTGYTGEEIAQMRPTDFVAPEETDLILHQIQKIVKTGHSRSAAHLQTKDRRHIPYEFTGSLLEHEGQQLICGTGRDVSELVRTQAALEESERMLRTLSEKSLVGIYLYQNSRFRYVNPFFADIFGYTADELMDLYDPIELITHPDEISKVRAQIDQRLSGQQLSAHYQFRGQTQAGEVRYIDSYGTRILYQETPAIIGMALDVTEKHRLEQEILRVQGTKRRRIGHQLHESIGSQLAGVSMLLNSLASTLKDQKVSQVEDLGEVAGLIRASLQEVRELARGLNPVKLNTHGLSAALHYLAEHTSTSNLSCNYEEAYPLPQLPNELASNLYWIVKEAVQNASTHANATHIQIRFSITENRPKITVEDNGLGVSPEEVKASEGLGIKTMRYRANLIGAQLCINQLDTSGTRITCRFNL